MLPPPTPTPCRSTSARGEPDLEGYLLDIGRAGGLVAVGIASADVFEETRADLRERRRQGLSGSMQFTYRNPERSTDPDRIVAGARALVVGAWSYRSEEPSDPHDPSDCRPGEISFLPTRAAGTVARYARKDHYRALRGALTPIAEALRERGWRAKVVCDDNALVDRAAAHRARLGWFGKNSLLLIPGLGSWSVLGSVVTDAPLRPSTPEAPLSHGQGCGTCTRCIGSCPTGAIVAPGVVDARRCLAWLLQASGSFPEEHRRALGGRIYGCDECQQVCPINRVADRRHPPPRSDRAAESWVDLVELLERPDDELIDAHGRWYIAGRDPRHLRRNALVALGNVGDGNDAATERVLRRWSTSDDAMLAEHARWACRRLGREDLAKDR